MTINDYPPAKESAPWLIPEVGEEVREERKAAMREAAQRVREEKRKALKFLGAVDYTETVDFLIVVEDFDDAWRLGLRGHRVAAGMAVPSQVVNLDDLNPSGQGGRS